MSTIRNTVVAGFAVAMLGLAASSTPAAAWGGGWGGGGWGGGWHHHGWGWGLGGVGAGLALGAAAAAAAGPAYGPACYFARQPVVDGYGNIVAYRRIRVCN